MTSVMDYTTSLQTVGGVLLMGLLLRAMVFESLLCISTMDEVQAVTSCKRLCLTESTV